MGGKRERGEIATFNACSMLENFMSFQDICGAKLLRQLTAQLSTKAFHCRKL